MENTAQSAKHNELESRAAAPAVHGRAPVLYLLSGDDELLLELGPLLGARYRTRPIEAADQIAPTSTTPWAIMIDSTARTDARAQAARVKQQHPLAPVLVICADGAAADWASPLARGTVSALIERGALSSEAFETALSIADAEMAAGGDPNATDGATPAKPPDRAPAGLLIGLVLLLAVPAGWYWLSANSNSNAKVTKPAHTAPAPISLGAVPPPLPQALPPATRTPPRTVLELLSDARVAFRDEKTLLPPSDGASSGKSALELYATVLAQDPQNEEARDGLRRLFVVASARIRADLSAGKNEEATRLLASFRGAGLDDAAIAALDADIAAARPRMLIAQARAAIAAGDSELATQLMAQLAAAGGDHAVLAELRNALDSHRTAAQLTALASHARALIKSGALLEPAGDNAQATVLSMQQLNRGDPLTLSTERDLQVVLIERTQAASRAAQFDLAQQLLNAAAILGNSPELAAARTQLQNETEAARTRTAAATAAAVAAATPQPAPAKPAEPTFVRAKPLAPLNAPYPERALEAGIQGYVIVEFTLDVKGRASELKIIESQPDKVFDAAALQAVRYGRYDTSELGESGMSRRARLRIAFRPQPKAPGQ